MLGGYASEKITFGDITTGASNDLEKATSIARKLVTRYGMSKLGPRTFGRKEELVFLGKELSEEKNYSETTANEIDKEVSNFIKEAYQTAEKILIEKRTFLKKIAKALLEKETIELEEFNALIGKTETKEKAEKKPADEKQVSKETVLKTVA